MKTKKQRKTKKTNKSLSERSMAQFMLGRKITKRKRRASEAASSRWPPPLQSKKYVSCQGNLFVQQKNSVTVATQTEEKKVEEVEVSKSKVSSVCESTNAEFHPNSCKTLFGNFKGQYVQAKGTLGTGHFSEKQWIRVIE